jgi:hypothetical protein
MGRQHRLFQAHVSQELHFLEALLQGLSGIGHREFVTFRGDVAVRQAAVVMRGSYKPIKIYFKGFSGAVH